MIHTPYEWIFTIDASGWWYVCTRPECQEQFAGFFGYDWSSLLQDIEGQNRDIEGQNRDVEGEFLQKETPINGITDISTHRE
ncbi:hypothetical protein [Aeromonas caviae]|uniref:hypothetical protein n=2 Tax=Aeromonas caviae TaxID=648 RepID=UPI002B466248|nr:hypothetical protein [Aeromonas caviae]